MRANRIKILDCTLRDGGYINHWEFKDKYISSILESLYRSNVDIIELGYLSDKGKEKDSTLFKNTDRINAHIKNLEKNTQKVVMINLGDFDISNLTPANENLIDGIRLAFHKEEIGKALKTGEIIKKLGYELYFQPMVTKRYKDKEFLEAIEQANTLCPRAFYIVDSFGSMSLKEFNKYSILCESNLLPQIALGFHAHNNMQLAFANAINLCMQDFQRNIILDSSIYGIGRGAGNLNTELIMNYLNDELKSSYQPLFLLDIIDRLILALMSKQSWGFSPAQYLSGFLNLHPNYATYLAQNKSLSVVQTLNMLSKIPDNKKASFDKKLIENIFLDYIFQSNSALKETLNFNTKDEILLIAPGKSVLENKSKIKQCMKTSKTIAINHKSIFKCDFTFFSNQKRYDEFKGQIDTKIIITNNIKTDEKVFAVLDIKKFIFIEKEFSTNATLLFINFLISQGVKSIKIAGFDGYDIARENYYYDEKDTQVNFEALKEANHQTKAMLKILTTKIKLEFLTPSLYKERE